MFTANSRSAARPCGGSEMEMRDRARSEFCPGVCGCTLCSRTHSSNRHLHPRPLTTKFQKPAGPASFCCKAAAHKEVNDQRTDEIRGLRGLGRNTGTRWPSAQSVPAFL